ncbi:flagellar basal body rod protein FlgB [Phenylobacterium sp.]|uniref:flagellar basal body rod protein FlgB n=1 Tax=Phenylobacterium sp. TaxID=1871053 RepID=UPI002E31D53B|nr:flagellar basal body rod protein FlgB [Phenylobacterium sp.]HEX4710969.1 flagellar basal body rod protein FlgB [Phenylobacterium sp.]
MDLADIPIFSMLRSRMGYLSEKQRVISENVANASTPGYTPHDLKAFSFQAKLQAVAGPGSMVATEAGHMLPPGAKRGVNVKPVKAKDSETTMDGNSVVLEEEMMKLTDARMDYDAAVSFYQKSLDILKLAMRRPGSGA